MTGPAVDAVVRHAYVHVPFCASVCPFCAFDVRVTRANDVDRYLDRLDAEVAASVDRLEVRPSTVYLGGGTPSHLDDGQLARLVGILSSRTGWTPGDPDVEATIEVHPGHADAPRCRRLVDLGFTRLSVGVQSIDDAVLARLGRGHSAATARSTVDGALASGASVSVDLIVAVPSQDWRADLLWAAASGVDHVSAYALTVEPGTPFARRGVRVDEVDELDALDAAEKLLGGAGLSRYEVSNHARPGHRCRHNLAYWRNECWVGWGPSAAGHEPAVGGVADGGGDGDAVTVRTTNARGAEWFEGHAAAREAIGAVEWWTDSVALGLRMTCGIDLAEIERRMGVPPPSGLGDRIAELVDRGWLAFVGAASVAPTAVGTRLLDRVMADLWAS